MDNEVFARIDQLMKKQRKKVKEINDLLGLKRCTYSNWKRGKSETYLKYLNQIAEFLNVTPNYLLCGSDSVETNENNQKRMEDALVDIVRRIPRKDAETLMKIVYAYVSSIEGISIGTNIEFT